MNLPHLILIAVLVLAAPLHVMGSPPSVSERELERQAQTAYEDGAYVRAAFYLKQALKLDLHNPKLLTNLGSAENEASNLTGALFFYRQALKLDPYNVGTLLGIGATLDLLYSGNQGLHISKM